MPYCRACGAEVEGSVLACPSCGERVWNRPVPHRNDPLAVTSLVTGVAGLFACPFVGSVAALVTGAVSLRRIREGSGLGGRRLAIAGLATGAVGMVWGVVFASIMWTWIQDRPVQPGVGAIPIPLQEDPDRDAQAALRTALTAAKTIFTDTESYEPVTPEALTLSEPGLIFVADEPSRGPAEVSVLVVSAHEIRLAVRSAMGTCFAVRDVTGPVDRGAALGTSFAHIDLDTCRASEMPDEQFGPRW